MGEVPLYALRRVWSPAKNKTAIRADCLPLCTHVRAYISPWTWLCKVTPVILHGVVSQSTPPRLVPAKEV